jgi:nucleoid DNA-binding protein
MMKGIFEELVEGHQLPKRLGQELLSSMVERVTQHLQKGNRIRIGGLGTLEVRKREARGSQSSNRRDDADRCQQEGGLPAGQGAKRGGLSSSAPRIRCGCDQLWIDRGLARQQASHRGIA